MCHSNSRPNIGHLPNPQQAGTLRAMPCPDCRVTAAGRPDSIALQPAAVANTGVAAVIQIKVAGAVAIKIAA
jgi:hypothetical protein